MSVLSERDELRILALVSYVECFHAAMFHGCKYVGAAENNYHLINSFVSCTNIVARFVLFSIARGWVEMLYTLNILNILSSTASTS